ncbi:MAG: glycine cleavage system protein GcvH [Planctomycetes bacterium]|nr:glycine cleavage system protein GcvH [Planctomycetota bacterium]MCC7171638.1 glycine cleavage system protein GcvH [Planctomycetota bacterium]
MIPNDRQYLESHEWAKKEGDLVVLGITDFAVKHLTDLVYIKLPAAGDQLKKGDRFGEIESVKAVSDLMSPVDGEVVEVNSELVDALDRVANDPYHAGWMVKVRAPSGISSMLDAAAYQKVTEADGH